MLKLLRKIFPSKHEKDIQSLQGAVEEINKWYDEYRTLSDEQLKAKTDEFRARIREELQEIEKEIAELKLQFSDDAYQNTHEELTLQLEEKEKELNETTNDVLDELLPEAFAVVKETCRRLVGQQWKVTEHTIQWDMIPFDVQLMGGIVLHRGKISEMSTGEGKTLVATMPMYLNALPGRGCHLVTVNDYLARRDAEWMGKIFEFLGLTVGIIQTEMNPSQRRVAYNCDITYGTNNEFGFDYLRDNMVVSSEDLVQRPHYYAIVDEVDSVLIDEARTPLIISGPVQVDDHKFSEMQPQVERLVNAQMKLVTSIVVEAEKNLGENGSEDKKLEEKKVEQAGIFLLRSQKGLPKHKRLQKLLQEPSNKILLQKTEVEFLRDQAKRMPEIIEELYYAVDEKNHQINLTEKGREFLAGNSNKDLFLLPDVGAEISEIESDEALSSEDKSKKRDELNQIYADRSDRIHTVTQLLKAYSLYEKDVEYVVSDDGKVMIVDEFTGRLLSGRRYSDGLHQAIEAKENVAVERDTQTLATITLQNYFRLYKKLAGMTGTAETEAPEFFDIYKLDVVVIPTNKNCIRNDDDDIIYKTKREKYNAVIQEIEAMRKVNRPVLVGTTSVEVSETLSRMLKRSAIPHNVLNAKQHQREAEIVASAGNPGVITIATNMAGRGTDIKLGPGVREAGGLHILGTERHESRRIDRQLRGRAGRQGDPGSSRFYLSLEDDLMRLFGSERIANIMERLGLQEGEQIQHPMITRSVSRAQKRVEENNFGIRKRLLEYDNVMNQQREIIYKRRKHALVGEGLRDDIYEMLIEFVEKTTDKYYGDGDITGLQNAFRSSLLVDVPFTADEFQKLGADGVAEKVVNAAKEFYRRKEEKIGKEQMQLLEKFVALQVIDEKWKEHLREMDDLKEGIHLRGYGQKDPLLEYKGEAFGMFQQLSEMIVNDTVTLVFKVFPTQQQEFPVRRPLRSVRKEEMRTSHEESTGMGFQGDKQAVQTSEKQHLQRTGKQMPIHVGEKLGRNDPCYCGSGKKYKNCHGK
ncbi:MAG: preprotein translocase subunit SecA [Ignavibacteria bacterium]|nr:preprotein translocase subunit SecA [Ignavibacteria bacterium]